MLRSFVSCVSCPHLGHGGCFPFSCLNTLLLVCSSQKQALHRRHECWPSRLQETHLNVSASKTWQLAWCSNWSSSQRKLWQNEQLNILPPWSHTPRSHSTHSASVSGQAQAWVLRHFLPWQTQASQKSHIAPTMARPVLYTPACLMTQSEDFIIHLVFPHCAQIGNF